MLSARRKSDGQIVTAYLESKRNAPFICLQCSEEVILKAGNSRINHFAHANPIACKFAEGESEAHRRCKMEIYDALRRAANVTNVGLEHPIGMNRPDVSAWINGVHVAIEVQISSLSLETIQERTIEYGRNGIYVLWLLPCRPALDASRYTPRLWERWIHACYFGRVYYWLGELSVASYHFDPHFKSIPKKIWHSKNGKKITSGGYSRSSKLYRTPVRGPTLNIAKDFVPREREWWSGNGMTLPDAKLFMESP